MILFNVIVTERWTSKDLRLCIHIKKNEECHQWVIETGSSSILQTNGNQK
jgi:hypothetical protein